MITYLITGGAGFIGSNFVKMLLKCNKNLNIIILDKLTYAGNLNNISDCFEDDRVQFIQGDICDINLIDNLFHDNYIDYVVNFAAESSVDRSIVDVSPFYMTNVGGTINLLNACKKYWAEDMEEHRFLQVSTDEVYGSIETGSFNESDKMNPGNPYSASKASADMFVLSYYNTYGLPVLITRSTNNYGYNQHVEKLIPKIVFELLNNKPFPMHGDGSYIRDWIFVEDHCNAIDFVLKNGVIGEIYNVGCNIEKSNIEIFSIISEYLMQLGVIKETQMIYSENRKGQDFRYSIDVSKLKSLGWKPITSFEDGIKKTIDWYVELLK